jgi:hypothetical protein
MRMSALPSVTPATNEEFIEVYGSYIRRLVQRAHIPWAEVEDVTSEVILAELTAKNRQGEPVGILALYDPEYRSEQYPDAPPISFRQFLSHRVMLRCRGKGETLARRAGRELLLCDTSTPEGVRWIELFGGHVWDDYPDLDAQEFIRRMREHLATVPSRVTEPGALVELFDELLRQIREEGEVTAGSITERFGISMVAANAWLARLREVVAGTGDELPAPVSYTISGITLTPSEIRSAIETLKNAKGIMVKQPLVRAGHPLAQAEDPEWYHPFSREERQAYPYLEVDPATRQKPAGHVKLAVIHRLERMLGMALAEQEAPPEPEPPEPVEEEDPRLQQIECELWKLGASLSQVELVKRLAQEYGQSLAAALPVSAY